MVRNARCKRAMRPTLEVQMKFTILIGAALAMALVGCTQETSSWSVESSGKTAAELSGVQSCVSQAKSCAAMATTPAAIDGCRQALQSCLGSLVAEAGLPPIPSFDAGVPTIPSFDCGVPPIPEAGVPAVPTPPSFDGGFPGSSCISDLESCLKSGTDPEMCATTAATCLEHAI
jgi:hypothetical protein